MPYLTTRGLGSRRTPQAQPPPQVTTYPGNDLLVAIVTAFESSSLLIGEITGGIYTNEAPTRTPIGPYAVVSEAGAHLELRTSTSEIHDTRIRFNVYAQDLDTAGALGDDLTAFYRGKPLSWTTGYASTFVPKERRQVKDHGQGIDAANVWHLMIEFQTRVKRAT